MNSCFNWKYISTMEFPLIFLSSHLSLSLRSSFSPKTKFPISDFQRLSSQFRPFSINFCTHSLIRVPISPAEVLVVSSALEVKSAGEEDVRDSDAVVLGADFSFRSFRRGL